MTLGQSRTAPCSGFLVNTPARYSFGYSLRCFVPENFAGKGSLLRWVDDED
jgi:hypothetical protein